MCSGFTLITVTRQGCPHREFRRMSSNPFWAARQIFPVQTYVGTAGWLTHNI